jgi:hypothetical protein
MAPLSLFNNSFAAGKLPSSGLVGRALKDQERLH